MILLLRSVVKFVLKKKIGRGKFFLFYNVKDGIKGIGLAYIAGMPSLKDISILDITNICKLKQKKKDK